MHAFSDFQSILQLSIAIHLVAEWADIDSIKNRYSNRIRRRMIDRVYKVFKYVDELKNTSPFKKEMDILFEPRVNSFIYELATKIFKVITHLILFYSIALLLITSYYANSPITTLWASIMIMPVFMPSIFFMTVFRYIYDSASSEQEDFIVSLIQDAETIDKEFNETHLQPERYTMTTDVKELLRRHREYVSQVNEREKKRNEFFMKKIGS